jgi:predicted outer membrane repeat protein
MSLAQLFRFNLILCLVAGFITASVRPTSAIAPDPGRAARPASVLAPQTDPIYVDADAPGPLHDGLSWTTAYTNLQTALITATAGSEIWVAEGLYTPGTAGDRTATFRPQLDAWGVALYGGFGGYGISETLRTQRDWVAHPTVLSGDLDHNDLTTASGVVTNTANITGTNAYHVVTSYDYTTLDGFTITAGQATGAYPDENGGGVLNGWNTTLSNIILSGNQAQYSGGGIYSYGNLTLISVTVSYNQAGSISQTGYGGGMYIFYGNPTLTNVTFSGNRTSGDGGGIYNRHNNLALLSVSFNDNEARFGGGMYNYSSNATLTNVTFDGNYASEQGGGMVEREGGSTLANVAFSNNQSDQYGGGMYFDWYNSSTLISVTFSGNQAYSYGGGIYNNYSSPTLITVTFSNNQASWGGGGGMYNDSGSPALNNVTFDNNRSEYGDGGGLYNAGYPTLVGVTFSNNQADNGGGMYSNYSGIEIANLSDVVFDNNQATSYGGGIYTEDSMALTDVIFSNNQARYGGGMYTHYLSASPTLTNVTFINNQAQEGGGGGMANYSSRSTLISVTFTGNSATGTGSEGGGGMANNSSDPVLTDVTFNNNQTTANGGGMYNYGSDPTLTNVTFSHNQAYGDGGGMYNRDSSDPTLITVTFTHNLAGSGGGMENLWNSNPALTNVIFSDNRANYNGGGMENLWNSSPTLTDITFTGNTSYYDGGGMANDGSHPTLINATFSGNQATGYGGGMANDGSHPTLINTTFSGNQAGYYGRGGGLYNNDSNPTLVNCILWGDTASADPEIYDIGTSVPNITYSDVNWASGVYTGTGNVNTDPRFVSPITATVAPTTTGNYRLLSTSPVIDAGNNFSATVSTDRDGNPRRMNVLAILDTGLGTPPIVDMGAYEVEGTPVMLTLNTIGDGIITSTPSGPTFVYGTVVTLSATPGTGSAFTGWSGDLIGATNPITLTMDADKSITGTFALNTYTLTLNTIGNGTITSDPAGSTFAYGTVVTLTGTPDTGSAFTGWSGDLNGATNPVTLTMDADKSITGTFALNTYTLTLNTIGNGSITSEPSGPTFAHGMVITLTATPGTGSAFTGWSGDLDGATSPITISIDADKRITGTFALNTYTLTLNTIGNGTITSEPSGPTFAYGSVVTLTATSSNGSAFSGWSGDLSSTMNPITLTVDADKHITGTFTLNTYTLILSSIGNGTITSEPPGSTFAYGSVVTLTATPSTGSAFKGWSGDLTGATNPVTLTIGANKSITGTFALNTYTLVLNTIGNGTITSEPFGSTFAYGTMVTLTATPGTGSAFTGWSGHLGGTTNPVTLTMDANKVITATFQWRIYLPLTTK